MGAEKKSLKSGGNQYFSLSKREDRVAVISIDVAGEKMNVLKADFAPRLSELIDDIIRDSEIKAVVIISGKPGSFIAGADISMIQAFTTPEETLGVINQGHGLMNKIAKSVKPIVVAIHGLCLGGGYELSLACHARIASDDPKTVLGLPEVMLGLLPGLGGTQRLPRLIGIAAALDIMLTGRHIKGVQAKKLGMVDEVVPSAILLEAAAQKALQLIHQKQTAPSWPKQLKAALTPAGLQKKLLESNSYGRGFLFKQARKRILMKTKGNYPAPERIIRVVEYGMSRSLQKGLQYEAKHFAELVMTDEAKQLINIYFASTALKKEIFIRDSSVEARPIHKLGILGGGLMGGGISVVSLDKADVIVRVKDIRDEGINAVLKQVSDYYQMRIKRKAISASDAARKTLQISGSLDYSGFRTADLVIEAVFEDLEIKHQVLKDIDALGNPEIIFATNTSSLRVRDIAKAAARPENVIGMHYFSPVEKMPLLEVIVHPKTADWVTRSCVEFGRKQGKTVIVVKDGAGFYVNRILAPYMNEAAHLAMESVPLGMLDKVIVSWGMPVGPIKLLDEVGIDIASHMMPNIEAEFGERLKSPELLNKMINAGRKGKKVHSGFYDYSKKAKGKSIDPTIYELLGVTPIENTLDASEIANRCMLPLINEAVMCLEDGTIRNCRDGDLGAVFGIGFPAFRGGPFRYIDAVGANKVVEELRALQALHGERYAPATLLLEKAEKGDLFY